MNDPMEDDLVGAYVLDALDEQERAAFELRLEQSPELTEEVASLREAVAMFGALDEQSPPSGLKSRVMAQIHLVEQEPEAGAHDVAFEHDPLDNAEGDDVLVTLSGARERRQRSSGLTRLGLAAGAIAAGVAAVLGISLAQLNDRVDSIEQTAAQIAAVVSAEDAAQVSVRVADGGVLSAVVSAEDSAAIVVSRDLATLNDGDIYVLWAIAGGVATPVGELIDGQAIPISADFELIGLTVEPDGPLDQPTGEILALIEA